MIKQLSFLFAGYLSCALAPAFAAAPSPEQLLPSDTLAVLTVPDWDKAKAFYDKAPQAQLWRDPSLKPFRDHLWKRVEKQLIRPLERQLGITLADYAGLARGQLTLAVTQNGWDAKSGKDPGFLLLVDCRGQEEQLKTHITNVRKKWVDAGNQIKTEKVRDVEFATLVIKREDIARALKGIFPATPGEAESDSKGAPFEISIGQSESLLLIGTQLKDLEKVLVRQSGGSLASLADETDFRGHQAAMFRDALAFGWIHFKPIYEVASRHLAEATADKREEMPFEPDKILAATGLPGVKTIAFKLSAIPEGSFAELFVGVPESSRSGIFKLLAVERKDAGPPPFVPADAVKFSRWRLDGQKAWTTLEAMISSISPQMANLLQMSLSMLGKEKDPHFDLKKDLIGNLGDDFVTFQKNPRALTLSDLDSPPTLVLIGSANAEKLAQGLRTGVSILPMASPDLALKEREFLGRKIYSMPLPAAPEGDDPKPAVSDESLHFSSSGGYVALSGDVTLVEEFLRSGETRGKALRETVGLVEAAQKVGGMNTGFFGFENQSETMRATLEALKNDSAKLQKLLSMASLGGKGDSSDGDGDSWFDFSLLPSFDKLAKYFHFIVYSGSSTAEGLSWKMFAPAPPQLR